MTYTYVCTPKPTQQPCQLPYSPSERDAGAVQADANALGGALLYVELFGRGWCGGGGL